MTRASSHSSTGSRPAVAAAHDLDTLFSQLYSLVERSPHVFASPLGPFALRGKRYHLPRFFYFGADAAEDAVRLAVLAGEDGTDLSSTIALTRFVENLTAAPQLGHGLHLSFTPLVNPSGAALRSTRNANATDLATEHWAHSPEPEIVLLRQDALARAYHGFIRLERGAVAAIEGWARTARGAFQPTLPANASENDIGVVWREVAKETPLAGPLTLADDLPASPFEIVLRFPQSWGEASLQAAVTTVLTRLVVQYRAMAAFGLNL